MKFFLSTFLFLSCSKAMQAEEEAPSLSNLKAKIESALNKLTVPQSSQVLEAGLSQDLWGKILFEYCDDASVQKVNRVSKTLYTVYLNQRKQRIKNIVNALENITLSDWIAPLTFLPTECSFDDNCNYTIKELPFDENDPSFQNSIVQEQQKLDTVFNVDKADTPAFFETIMRYPHRLLCLPQENLAPYIIGSHIFTRLCVDFSHHSLEITHSHCLDSGKICKFQKNFSVRKHPEGNEISITDKLSFGIHSKVECPIFPLLSVQSEVINARGWNINCMKNLQQSPNVIKLSVEFFKALETLSPNIKSQIKTLYIENFTDEEIKKIPQLCFSALDALHIRNSQLPAGLIKTLTPIRSLKKVSILKHKIENNILTVTSAALLSKRENEPWKFHKKTRGGSPQSYIFQDDGTQQTIPVSVEVDFLLELVLTNYHQ